MGNQNPKPERCEWCRRLTESSFLHYLGAAKAWVCYSCFHGKPYDDFIARKQQQAEQAEGGAL